MKHILTNLIALFTVLASIQAFGMFDAPVSYHSSYKALETGKMTLDVEYLNNFALTGLRINAETVQNNLGQDYTIYMVSVDGDAYWYDAIPPESEKTQVIETAFTLSLNIGDLVIVKNLEHSVQESSVQVSEDQVIEANIETRAFFNATVTYNEDCNKSNVRFMDHTVNGQDLYQSQIRFVSALIATTQMYCFNQVSTPKEVTELLHYDLKPGDLIIGQDIDLEIESLTFLESE